MSFPTWLTNTSLPFATYLLPSTPFNTRRGRQEPPSPPTSPVLNESPSSPITRPQTPLDVSLLNSSSDIPSPPTTPPSTSPFRVLQERGSQKRESQERGYLKGHTSYLRCVRCSTDLCFTSQIISKGFTGRHGRAYLVCPNISDMSRFSSKNDNDNNNPANASTSTAGIGTYTTNHLYAGGNTNGNGNGNGMVPARYHPHGTSHWNQSSYGRGIRTSYGNGTGNGNGRSKAKEKETNDHDHDLPNTILHKPCPRQLVTGAHTVSDISCAGCGAVLGWKYIAAEDEGQRYKVGKYILETKRVCTIHYWEEHSSSSSGECSGVNVQEKEEEGKGKEIVAATGRRTPGWTRSDGDDDDDGDIQFDSQDEEECDDLFAGVWSPSLAGLRRKNRRFGRE